MLHYCQNIHIHRMPLSHIYTSTYFTVVTSYLSILEAFWCSKYTHIVLRIQSSLNPAAAAAFQHSKRINSYILVTPSNITLTAVRNTPQADIGIASHSSSMQHRATLYFIFFVPFFVWDLRASATQSEYYSCCINKARVPTIISICQHTYLQSSRRAFTIACTVCTKKCKYVVGLFWPSTDIKPPYSPPGSVTSRPGRFRHAFGHAGFPVATQLVTVSAFSFDRPFWARCRRHHHHPRKREVWCCLDHRLFYAAAFEGRAA